mgnify:CR=1 FL=1
MAGLFDYQSPENMRAARLQPLLVSGAQMGQQPLLSQLVSQMSNAGANIGATGAGMLGLQLPEEARQQQVQGIMQGVDLTSPEGLMGASKRLSELGLTKEAELTANKANTVQKQNYEMGALSNSQKLQQAITDIPPDATYEQRAAAEVAAIRRFGTSDQKVAITKQEGVNLKEGAAVINRGKVLTTVFGDSMDRESANAIAANAGLFDKVMEDKLKYRDTPTEVVTSASGVRLVNSNTGKEIANYGLPPRAASTKIEVNTGDTGMSAYAKKVGTDVAEKDVGLVTAAEKAHRNMTKIEQTLTLLKESPNLRTGMAAELLKNVDRAKAQFLNDKKAGKRVTDTEYLQSLTGQEVFPMIGELGIGARGIDTPAEKEFLLDVFTGRIQLSKETLIKMTENRKGNLVATVTDYNEKVNSGYYTAYEESISRKLPTLDIVTQGGNNLTFADAAKEAEYQKFKAKQGR